MWLLAGGVAFRHASPDALVLVGPEGSIVEGDAGVGYDGGRSRDHSGYNVTAHNIHHPIHAARPDVVAAIHTHTAYGTPLAALVEPLRMVSQESCAFFGDQAIYEGEDVDVRDLDGGARIATSLGSNRLVFLANHGMLTVGESVAAALGFFFLAERAAEVQMKAPAARVISDAAAAATYDGYGHESTGELVFDYLVASKLD